MDIVLILKALCDENRLRIYNILSKKGACVCEMEAILDLNQANVSRHLAKLRSAGILERKKEGQWIRYFISETFLKEESELSSYLDHKLESNQMIVTDNKKLEKYNTCNLTCVDVKETPGKVFSLLHQK